MSYVQPKIFKLSQIDKIKSLYLFYKLKNRLKFVDVNINLGHFLQKNHRINTNSVVYFLIKIGVFAFFLCI